MKIVAILSFLAMATGQAVASPIDGLAPSDDALVHEAINRQLLDPQSAIFDNVIAIRDPSSDGDVMVCGSVRGKNGFGGYAQPQPFMVLVGNQPKLLGGGRSVSIAKVADTEDRAQLLLRLCRQKAAAAQSAASASVSVIDDLRQYGAVSSECSVFNENCDREADIAKRLGAAGWCQEPALGWVPCGS